MAPPAHDKTWAFVINAAKGYTDPFQLRNVLRYIKDTLKALPVPWTVSGSCDMSTSNMSGVDLWDTDAKLVQGTNSSWIVLRQPAISEKFEVLIHYTATTLSSNFYYTFTGFGAANGGTDGSVSAIPTATNYFSYGQKSWMDSVTNQWIKVHVMQSSDGKCNRVVLCRNSLVVGYIYFDHVKNPNPAWTTPYVFGVNYTMGGATLTYYNFCSANSGIIHNNGVWANTRCATTTYAAGYLGELQNIPNDITGEYAFTPITYVSFDGGSRGKWGEAYDLYMGPNTLNVGDQFDETGSKKWCYCNNAIIPWDGTNIIQVS